MAGKRNSKAKRKHAATAARSDLVSVIELGSTSIRMIIAQVDGRGTVSTVDALQQAVALGRDTFTSGVIAGETTESCVSVLRTFRQTLREYGIRDEKHITAVATSAVREATNREAFLDRILIATGINVHLIDEAEVNRFTYLAVRPYFTADRVLRASSSLVIEVGGGSTEALLFQKGRVRSAHMYSLGSLRLRRQLEELRTPDSRITDIISHHADETVARIITSLQHDLPERLMIMGGDARLACKLMHPDWDHRALAKLKLSDFSALVRRLCKRTVDELVREHRLSYADAESLVPALVFYARLCRALKVRSLFVAGATLRDGVLAEVASRGAWTKDFQRQILNAAMDLALKFNEDERRARRVSRHVRELFALLQDEHGLDPRYGVLLVVAAILHNIGHFVNRRSHHKHTMYLILNSDIFGISARDLELIAIVARYHRRAMPKPTHERYATLPRRDRIIVAKLAAILRLGVALDIGRLRIAGTLGAYREPGRLVIPLAVSGDTTLEEQAVQTKSDMFEQVYGMRVELQTTRGREETL